MNEINVDKLLDGSTKIVFSYKLFLAEIMKDCIYDYKDEDVHTIAHEYIENDIYVQSKYVNYNPSVLGVTTEDNTDNKRTTFDLLFYARLPKKYGFRRIKINLELQANYYPGYDLMNRMIYYESRNISNQLNRDFKDKEYNSIVPVYSIMICMNPPKYKQDGITTYAKQKIHNYGNVCEDENIYSKHKIVMVYLSYKKSQMRSIQMCNILLSNTLCAFEKKKQLKEQLNIDVDEITEKEMSNMCDYSAYIRSQGISQGISQGEINTFILNIKKIMKNMNLTYDEAIANLEVPEKYHEACRKAIYN